MRITEMMALEDSRKGMGQPSGNAGIMGMFLNQIKEKQDEKRKQKNIQDQMTNAQKMMEQMAGMEDKSLAGKGSSVLDGNQADLSRRGIIKNINYVPVKEMTMDENGNPSMKFGFRAANPAEQKNLMEIEQAKLDQAKAEELRQHALGYIQGTVPESVMGEMIVKNGGKPEDLVSLRGLRDSTRQQGTPIPQGGTPIMSQSPQMSVPEGYRMAGMKPDDFGNMRSTGIEPIPMTEIKAQRDMQEQDKANALKSQDAIKSAEDVVKTIDHLNTNINYFGPIEGRMPAGLNTGKREWAKNYDYLQAKNILSILGDLKSQSRTGATGFGAMNEKELALIENAAMKLDKQMDEATAKKYLDEMKTAFQTIIDREKGVQGGQAQSQPQISREEAIAELKRRGKL